MELIKVILLGVGIPCFGAVIAVTVAELVDWRARRVSKLRGAANDLAVTYREIRDMPTMLEVMMWGDKDVQAAREAYYAGRSLGDVPQRKDWAKVSARLDALKEQSTT